MMSVHKRCSANDRPNFFNVGAEFRQPAYNRRAGAPAEIDDQPAARLGSLARTSAGWPQKSKTLPNYQRIVSNRISLPMRLDLFVKSKK